MSKLWGGRFAKETDKLVHQFNASLGFDMRLASEDITGSIAWAKGLAHAQIITGSEVEEIIDGLESVQKEIDEGTFVFADNDEDVHTAVERRLTEIIGAVGGKLHTGRSRNDQVATDFRLWVMQACDALDEMLSDLQTALINHAEQHIDTPLPGYTHLQHAQPVIWGHWLMSHFWPLVRDRQKITNVRENTAVLPLGSAALAGTAYPIDREFLANELGFNTISPNSLDAVSGRDFVADFLYATTMIGLHLSRLSEQLIIFSSAEFGFILIDDQYSTGSSLMPQKKNPDTLELTRGKSGRLLGNLTGFLATIKGLPSTYDKDLQEDKAPVFDAFDTLSLVIPVMTGLINTLKLRPQKMAEQLEPSLLATDLADYLVKKGMPFRQAHGVVGQVVQFAENRQGTLTDLTLEDFQSIDPTFGEDVMTAMTFEGSLASRNVAGGTGGTAVAAQIELAKQLV
ncbi:MAG: argininosuccinate lyase [Chloroflexota bacterium]